MKTKIIVIIIVILLIIITGGVAILKLSPSGFSNGVSEKGEEHIKTNIGDEFELNYVTRDFPEYATTVHIIDAYNKKDIGVYRKPYGFTKPQFTIQVDFGDLRCYQVEDILIYKTNIVGFKGVKIDLIKDEKYDASADLITISKALVTKKEWKWVKVCASLLVKAGDKDILTTLESFASGQFSQEELELNKNSEITKEDMQDFAKQLLTQK